MKQKIIIGISLLLLAGAIGFAISKLTSKNMLSGYATKNPSDTGVYYTTTTDHTLRDGYGGAIRVDENGQVLISPSSTINLIGE